MKGIVKKKKTLLFLSIIFVVLGCGLIGMKKQEKSKYSRIEWIHELHQQFGGENGEEDYEFSDLSKESKYYKDALWAKNQGMFGENPDNIYPEQPLTREFAASTLNSCLNLKLADKDSYTYIDISDVQFPEDDQIAVKRGWFELEQGYFAPDEVVTDTEISKMLEDTEEILSMAVIDPNHDNTYEYAEGVVEIPEDVPFQIQDAENVILDSEDVDLESGDRFVIYQEGIPLAYVAKKVTYSENKYQVQVEKADYSVYQNVDEQGSLEITEKNAEIIPEDGVALLSSEDTIGTGSSSVLYEDGKLSMKTALGDSNASAYISNLHLNHSFAENGYTISVSGNWGINSTLSANNAIIDNVPLCTIHILGIGTIKVSISMTQEMKMKGDMSGSFCAGVTVLSDGTTRGINQFNVSNCSITGQGSITASFKVSAGVDIVVASADVYAEVGAKTQYTSQIKKKDNSNESVHCQDYKYYLFLTVGAEAKYYAFWSGKMETLAGKELSLDEKNTPYIKQWHWEDGVLVNKCTMGMTVADLSYGGTTAVTGSTITTDNRERVVETDITLKNDIVVPQGFTINDGTLNLNGHVLTVQGDLIQSAGNVKIYGGILKVEGDYRIQRKLSSGGYGESDGRLDMSIFDGEGKISVGRNFVIQSTEASRLERGTLCIAGDFEQKNTDKRKDNFVPDSYFVTQFLGEKKHTIMFENSNANRMGEIVTEGDIIVNSDMIIDGDFDLNAHTVNIHGNLLQTSGTMYINGGDLDVDGDYYIAGKRKEIEDDGTESIDYSAYGRLKMIKETDKVHIAGKFLTYSAMTHDNLLTNGTMYVGGDFIQKFERISGRDFDNCNNFNATGNHRVVFNGTTKQKISFDTPIGFNGLCGSGFANVTFNNSNIELESGIRGFTLNEDISLTINTEEFGIYGNILDLNNHLIGNELEVTKDNFTYTTGELNLSGNTLNIAKNMVQNGGKIDLDGGNINIGQDLTQNYGKLDLHRGKLAVKGNVSQNGEIYVNAGQLHIEKKYYIVGNCEIEDDGTETIAQGSGSLKMIKEADIVKVAGKFLMYSKVAHTDLLTNGVMYIGGDFEQKSESWTGNKSNFNATKENKIVFDGIKKQKIKFETPSSSGFANVVFDNPDIELESGIRGFTLNQDISLSISAEQFGVYDAILDLNHHLIENELKVSSDNFTYTTGEMNLSGNVIKIKKDMVQSGGKIDLNGGTINIGQDMTQNSGDFDLHGGKMKVERNVLQNGAMYINGGELDIAGDYYIAGKREIEDDGTETVGSGYGYLKMVKSADKVKVGKNFQMNTNTGHSNYLTAGTMYVGGDFKQKYSDSYGRYNFKATGNHTVVLNGENIQNVSFESTESKFNNLYLTKEKDTGYTFSPDNCWNKLYINTAVSEVQISPTDISLEKGDSLQLKAKVLGINKPSQKVEWSVEGAQSEGTEISESGLLKIALRENAQTLMVKAVSAEDNSKFATVTVKVLPATVTVDQVKIRPNISSVFAGEELQFSAKVSGTNEPSQKVKWSLSGNKSSNTAISADGLLKVTKDETAETLQIIAVSEEDKEKSAIVVVEVLREEEELPFVEKVTISPKTVSVNPGDHTLFQAKVLGRNNPSGEVIWTVEGNTSENTVIADGMLTVGADETAETLKVTATSAFDPAKSASASVEVVTVEINSTVENVVVSLKQGTVTRFYAKVLGANNPSQNVIWSLEGNISKDTVFTEDGELTIAKDETAEILVVTAVSEENHEKSGVLAFRVLENDTTPQTPEKPEAEEITSASVRLNWMEGYEYSLDAKNWQDYPFFDGLESDTEYTFFQRVKETVVNYASDASEGLTVATLPKKDNHEHTFGEPVFIWSEDGKSCTVTFVCTENPEHTESYEASVSNAVKVKATCSQMGTTEYKAVYGEYSSTKEMQDIPLDAKNHVGGTEIRNAKEATCEEEGYTGDIYCKKCGEILQKGTVTDKKEHIWDQGEIVKEPTCTQDGEKKYTCTLCQKTKPEVIASTGHRIKELRNVKDATCELAGYSGDTYCKDCGKKLESGTVIPATGHSFGEYEVVKEPTSTEEGLKSRTCSVCGKVESVTIQKKANTDQKETETKDTDKNQQQTETPDNKPNQQPKPFKKTTKKIKLNRKKLTLKKGKTFKLKVTLTPKDSQDKITYKTSNKKIATVSKTGKIKAKKKGKVKITAISGKKKAVCTVKVK